MENTSKLKYVTLGLLLVFAIISTAYYAINTVVKTTPALSAEIESMPSSDELVTSTVIKLQIGSPVMTVNGKEQPIDENGTVPIVKNNRTLLPVRTVVEAMGGAVKWEYTDETLTLTHGSDVFRLTIGSTTAYINDNPKTLDTTPVIINSRTMLPIRLIAESFGFNVVWDSFDSMVTITASESSKVNSITANTKNKDQIPIDSAKRKVLVAYFSHTGNTREIANQIHEKVGGDTVEIVTVKPYPTDYDTVVDQAKREQEADFRPELATKVKNMDSYDVIFVGYPIWWGTMPMAVFSFLEGYDFSGKTIVPFCTHEGSNLGQSISDIKKLCPQSNILDGHAFRGSNVKNAQNDLSEWLRKLGMIE